MLPFFALRYYLVAIFRLAFVTILISRLLVVRLDLFITLTFATFLPMDTFLLLVFSSF